MDTTELRIKAQKQAAANAKIMGWPLGGKDYQDDMESTFERLVWDELNKTDES